SSLRVFFKYALRMEWIESNPMELIQYSVKKQHLPEFFYEDEMRELFTAIEVSESSMQLLHSALVELLYATGMRVSELTNLTLQQVDYDMRSEEHTSELQSRFDLVCRLLLEKK